MPESTLVVYSDYVCPFCYLGKASLESYLEQADDPPNVAWRPFDLRLHQRREDGSLDESVPTGKNEAYYERARQNVQRLQEEYGVEMVSELVDDVDAWNAHKLMLWVDRELDDKTTVSLHDQIFEALWREGRDIGDPDVLVELAASVGIEEDQVRSVLKDDNLDQELRDAFIESHREGITGVPSFEYGELTLSGAMPPEHLAKLIENA